MADEFGGTGWAITEFSWDVKYAGLQIQAAKHQDKDPSTGSGNHRPEHQATLDQYKSKAEHYLCACLGKNGAAGNVNRTDGGMLYVRQWNNMQYVTNAALLLTVYSRYLAASSGFGELNWPDGPAHADELLADYVLGANPAGMSYLVGHGRRFPRRVHHRAASIVSHRADGQFIGCVQGYDHWYRRPGANPNVVVGAIVRGPDHRDLFQDRRGNYEQTEACTYNEAVAGRRLGRVSLPDEARDQHLWMKLVCGHVGFDGLPPAAAAIYERPTTSAADKMLETSNIPLPKVKVFKKTA
ncbi:hypothetical protein EJB05_49002, partial [Eragrostis curvula]